MRARAEACARNWRYTAVPLLARRVSLAVCLWLSWSSQAHAEELGTAGNLTFAAERLFGLYINNQSVGANDADFSVVALGWNKNSGTSTLTTPRLGVDYFLGDAFTLGGVIGFFSHNVDNGGASTTATGLLFGARAGYALRLGHAVSFWPRGGLTFTSVGYDGLGADEHQLALSIEAPFTLSPAEHVAVLAGPMLDITLTGKRVRQDYSEVVFGLMIGLIGWAEL